MLSKCIKMHKYSFKNNLFFLIWRGGQHTTPADPGLPKPPWHTAQCVGLDSVWVAPDKIWVIASCWPNHRWITWNFCVLTFLRVKKYFFQKLLKIAKNHFRTIKILFFFQIFCDYKGGWVVQTKSGKFQFFFWTLPLMYQRAGL